MATVAGDHRQSSEAMPLRFNKPVGSLELLAVQGER
jgi:hypothetical protein